MPDQNSEKGFSARYLDEMREQRDKLVTELSVYEKGLENLLVNREKAAKSDNWVVAGFLAALISWAHWLSKASVDNALRNLLEEMDGSSKKNLVRTPPGGLAHIALSTIFPQKVYERQFQQQIADMREESFECDAHGKTWFRRWVIIRGHFALSFSVLLYFKVSLVKKCVDIWKAT